MAEKCTNTSSPPPSCAINPNPLSALNHFTVPCAIPTPLPDEPEPKPGSGPSQYVHALREPNPPTVPSPPRGPLTGGGDRPRPFSTGAPGYPDHRPSWCSANGGGRTGRRLPLPR